MTLKELAHITRTRLVFENIHTKKGKFVRCSLDRTEIKDSLTSQERYISGLGRTRDIARNNYSKRIRGKYLVVRRFSGGLIGPKPIFPVPRSLTA